MRCRPPPLLRDSAPACLQEIQPRRAAPCGLNEIGVFSPRSANSLEGPALIHRSQAGITSDAVEYRGDFARPRWHRVWARPRHSFAVGRGAGDHQRSQRQRCAGQRARAIFRRRRADIDLDSPGRSSPGCRRDRQNSEPGGLRGPCSGPGFRIAALTSLQLLATPNVAPFLWPIAVPALVPPRRQAVRLEGNPPAAARANPSGAKAATNPV